MYIYNITTNIDDSAHDQWLTWMKEIHIPDMLATGKFLSAKMCKVLIQEEMGGTTYSVQFTLASKKDLESFYENDAKKLQEDGHRLFHGKFMAFSTELEIISEH